MESFFYLFMAFVCGIIFNVFWGATLGLGYGTLLFKNTATDCLLMMTKNIQSIFEIHQLKYMALKMMEREERYIEFQKKIDENEIKSLKNTVIRNYINSVPSRYKNMVQFHDWDSAVLYLNNILQHKGGQNDYNK